MFRCISFKWDIISSDIVDIEISNLKDDDKRLKVQQLVSLSSYCIKINEEIIKRAYEFEKVDMKAYDSLHLSCAEYNKVDLFFTTDDNFLKKAQKLNTKIRIYNPVTWLMEVTGNECNN